MGKKPHIGVTGHHRRWSPSWWCIWLVLRLTGASAERISVANPGFGKDFDGLVISGGDDIGPELYGGSEMPKARIDRRRDALEASWIRRALKQGLPVLGICRGAQLLNVILGGSLIQDVRTLREKTSNRASLLPTKTVKLCDGSRLANEVERSTLRVNSLHHQAIREPGDNLKIVGRDRDDLCQAIEANDNLPAMGVQWHPEYMFYLSSQRRVFQWLVERATWQVGEL